MKYFFAFFFLSMLWLLDLKALMALSPLGFYPVASRAGKRDGSGRVQVGLQLLMLAKVIPPTRKNLGSDQVDPWKISGQVELTIFDLEHERNMNLTIEFISEI